VEKKTHVARAAAPDSVSALPPSLPPDGRRRRDRRARGLCRDQRDDDYGGTYRHGRATTEPRINIKLAVESNASPPITVTVAVEDGFEETVTLNPTTVRDFTDRLERSGSYDVRVSTPENSVEASISSYEGYRFIIQEDGEIFVTAEIV
jgi:hypothetical protein